ncbi:MAG: lysylphosphatidylglycerol synthase transmembrane domain-containing protein [Anaerolineae bacterium]
MPDSAQPNAVAAPPARPPSLWRRLVSPRSLLSFAVAGGLVWYTIHRQDRSQLAAAGTMLRGANPAWFVLALGVYYASFPIRGLRWRILLGNAGERAEHIPRLPDLGEIIYLSWFVTTLVPAKLGDVYRGWLYGRAVRARAADAAGIAAGTAAGDDAAGAVAAAVDGGAAADGASGGWSRGMGTIVAERALDLIVLVVLMVTAGLLTYGDVVARSTHGSVAACFGRGFDAGDLGCVLAELFTIGGVGVLVLVGGLVAFARFGVHVERLIPARFERLNAAYATFARGLVLSFGRFGPLLALSAGAWLCEGAAFWCVSRALGVGLPVPLVVFFSLLQAFLTAIPATPGALGFEGILKGAIELKGYAAGPAIALTVLYRAISYLSLLVGGMIVFVFSRKTRSL